MGERWRKLYDRFVADIAALTNDGRASETQQTLVRAWMCSLGLDQAIASLDAEAFRDGIKETRRNDAPGVEMVTDKKTVAIR